MQARNGYDHGPVRRRSVLRELSTLLLGLALNSPCLGDIITLKNGKQIRVERCWEQDNKIQYEIGGNVYGFSKSLVQKVESGIDSRESADTEPQTARPTVKSIPIEVQEDINLSNLKLSSERSEIILDGKVNEQKLREIESEARRNPHDVERQDRYRNALIELANLQFRKGDQTSAMRTLQEYLSLDPANLQASLALATLYLKQGLYSQVENVLSQAEIKNDHSSELYYLLGTAYYLQDKNDRARSALRRSLDLQFREEVDQLLKKIDGENAAENDFKQSGSLHFMLKYEGTETNRALGKAILSTLERSFSELETSLNYSPKESIAVVLYTGESFFDVTRSPSWVGALNDGKIRLPIKGITSIDQSLSKNLKHELTHSFVRLKTRATCPVWLNEGLAQYLTGDTAQGSLPLFKEAILQNRFLPLRRLEAPFINLSWAAATWAYQESLLAVEYLVRIYGIGDLQRVLSQSGNSLNFEAALQQIFRIDYEELDKQLQQYVSKQ